MGTGKRPTPGGEQGRGQRQAEAGEDLTVAELVCELLYAGKTRAEIAGYDDAFLRWVLCRRRDENGSLVRVDPDLPRWVTANLDSSGQWSLRNTQPYGAMFHQVARQRGLDDVERLEAWRHWREENPEYGYG